MFSFPKYNRSLKHRGRFVAHTSNVRNQMEMSGIMPDVEQYGGYNGNYGAHCMGFSFMGISFWFSYSTLIAFHVPGYEQVVLKNYWGPTTGRHLGAVDYSTERVEQSEFLVRLNNQVRAFTGIKKLTLPFLRVDADPKTLERTGFIGMLKLGEDEVPPPKPKKSDFYGPKNPSRAVRRKMRRVAREKDLRARLSETVTQEYGNQLDDVEAFV